MPRAHVLATAEALSRAAARLTAAARLSVDTEGNGMHAYRARLCVLQLADASSDEAADEVFIVDALAVEDLAPLAPLLGPEGPPKIVHDLGYDARMLRDAALPFGNVVDTALHARLLGARETGLASLLEARLGVTLAKELQRHDWGARPLPPEALTYLTADVAHLGPLAALLLADAARAGLVAEVEDETACLLARAMAGDEAPHAYMRVRGARDLAPVERAVLRELVAVRDAEAEARDIPAGRVVSGAGLLQAARARPRNVPALKRAAGLHGPGAEIAEALVDAVARGEAAGEVPDDERAWFAPRPVPGDGARRRDREEALLRWREEEAQRRGVPAPIVLPGRVVAILAQRGVAALSDPAARTELGALRLARYGEALAAVLAGPRADPTT